jgi:hypothetical protein
MMKPRILLVAGLLVAGGCAKRAEGKASAAPGGAMYDYDDADGAGAVSMDAASTPMEPEPGDTNALPEREFASPAPASAFKEKAKAGGGQPDGAEKAVDLPDEPAARHIVYTASMLVSVFNLEDAMVEAEAIPEKYGGYIQSMSIGMVVLRVPSKSLRKVMDDVAEYGVVEQRTLQAQDVTAEFVDIDSRLRALEETHKQLLELLSKARTVKEALEVREALDRITSELEVLKGRMRQLQNLIAYSTLALTLQERGPHVSTPSSNDPFTWVNDLGVEATEWR